MIVKDVHKLKEFILSNIRQEELLSKLLDIPEADIIYCLSNKSNKIKNPLRDDNDPSLGMMYVKDGQTGLPKIKLRDFGNNYYRGDCFDFAGYIFRLNPLIPADFISICNVLISIASGKIVDVRRRLDITIKEKVVADINITIKDFTTQDLEFWHNRGVSTNTLRRRFVYPVLHAFMNGALIYKYNKKDVCYAYMYGIDPISKKSIVQLYFPFRKKKDARPRFITNNYHSLNNFLEFPKGTILVLTKSYKDELAITDMINSIPELVEEEIVIKSISNENIRLTEHEARVLQSRYKYIFTNFDFDRAGCMTAQIMRKQYGFAPIMFTTQGVKDFSECYYKKGAQVTRQFTIDTFEYVLDYIHNVYGE